MVLKVLTKGQIEFKSDPYRFSLSQIGVSGVCSCSDVTTEDSHISCKESPGK